MTLITLVLVAVATLLNPVGSRTVTPSDIIGPIGESVAAATPLPTPTPAPQDIVGPIGE